MPTPVPRLSGSFGDFFVGLTLPLEAARTMTRSGRLMLFGLFSSVVTCAALVGIWLVAHHLATRWVGEGGWRTAASFALAVMLWVIGALTVPPLVLAPLQDPISEATEAQCGGYQAPAFSLGRLFRSALTSIAHTGSRLSFMLAGFLVLLPLNAVPGVGSAVYGVLSSGWAMWWLAAEYLSGPMARHLLPFRDVIRTMRAHLAVSLGFGLSLYVLLWVPILNFFLVPLAVVGGTLLFRALIPQVP
jgi:CysZ protein